MNRFPRRMIVLGLTMSVAACATAPADPPSVGALAAQVAAEVCLPYVADGVPFDQVKRRLGASWSQDWPELLTSGPPGPVFRQRLNWSTRGVLSFVPDNSNPQWGVPHGSGCSVTIHGAQRAAMIAAVEAATAGRALRRRDDLHGYIVADWCVADGAARGATIWVMDYGGGRMGLAVNASGETGQGC